MHIETQLAPAPTVCEMVRSDYRLADVFKKWGINYCCGGNQTIAEACQRQGLDLTKLENELQTVQQGNSLLRALPFAEWPVDFLVDYITYVHHQYLKTTGPKLEHALAAFVKGHDAKYPHLREVHGLLKKLLTVATEQMQYEEETLFPYIRQVYNAVKRNESYGPLLIRTMRKSLAEETATLQPQLLHLLDELRSATHQYQFAPDACTNHQVLYHKLQEFDTDLVQHNHLENNILLPEVLRLETELLQA